jgi:hypothetical protein
MNVILKTRVIVLILSMSFLGKIAAEGWTDSIRSLIFSGSFVSGVTVPNILAVALIKSNIVDISEAFVITNGTAFGIGKLVETIVEKINNTPAVYSIIKDYLKIPDSVTTLTLGSPASFNVGQIVGMAYPIYKVMCGDYVIKSGLVDSPSPAQDKGQS